MGSWRRGAAVAVVDLQDDEAIGASRATDGVAVGDQGRMDSVLVVGDDAVANPSLTRICRVLVDSILDLLLAQGEPD